MPRVVLDQRAKFETDELFRKLSRETEVRYTGFRERPAEERRARFRAACSEGGADIAFVNTGTNLHLLFQQRRAAAGPPSEGCDFEKEQGKVHLRSSFIMNGVCVRWRGWIHLDRLDGVGCLEFNQDLAQAEDAALREQIESCNRKLRDFEDKRRAFRPPGMHRRTARNSDQAPPRGQPSPAAR